MATSNGAIGNVNKNREEVLAMDTEYIPDPFKRSSVLDRSPNRERKGNGSVKSVASDGTNSGTIVPSSGTPNAKASKKRKPENSPVIDNEVQGADRDYAECLKTLFREIYSMKEAVENFEDVEPFLNRAVEQIERIGVLSNSVLISDKAAPVLKSNKQEPCLKCRTAAMSMEDQLVELNQRVSKGEECPELIELLKKDWKEESYRRSTLKVGNPALAKDGDFILIKGDKEENSGLTTLFQNRFPEVEEIIEDGLDAGQWDLVQVTSTRGGVAKNRSVYVVNMTGKEMETLLKLKEEWKGRKGTINLGATSSYEWTTLRKTLEIVFLDCKDLKIEMYIPKKDMPGKPLRKENKEQNKDDVILIKAGALPYADMVKNVKESITDPEVLGVSIKSIVKSGKDEMRITTEKGKGNLLKSEIMEKVKDSVVKVKEDKMTVKVLYIEEGYSKEDVIRDIKRNEGCENIEEKNAISLFSTKKGYQVAILALDTKVAINVLKKGILKIGWVHCDVKKNVSTRRCINCLRVGHRAEQCREERKQEVRCFKCTKSGHKAQDCQGAYFCMSCNKEGHADNSHSCPLFKKYLRKKEIVY